MSAAEPNGGRQPPNDPVAVVKPPSGSTEKKSILEIFIDEIDSLKKKLDGAKAKIKKKSDESNTQGVKKSKIKSEDRNVEKLSKELEYISFALTNLNKFEVDLNKPLKLLEDNVNDITEDSDQLSNNETTDVPVETLEKRIQHNIGVLRSNITKLKIKIPLQHQPVITSSEASRDFQKTVASSKFGDLPSLCEQGLLVQTDFYKEVERVFEKDLVDASAANKELEAMRMKICLLSFAIFPEDAEIRRRLLKLWWIGEDLVPKGADARKFADATLSKFVELGFIEPVKKGIRPDGDAKSFKMPPLIRAALIKLAEEAKFFQFDDKGNPTGMASEFDSKRICLVKMEEFEEEKELKLRLAEDVLKKMETVFNVSEQYPDLRITVESFAKMRKLGVLYLGRWENTAKRHIEVENTDFLKNVKKMRELKFLSFQGMSRITTLPSLGVHLTKLRILDLRACYNLEQLPEGLDFLKRLTYLDISECYLLDFMPRTLTALSKLIVLKGFVISDQENSCPVRELHRLKHLNKLSIIVNTEKFDAETLRKELSDFPVIKKLKVSWGGRPVVEDQPSNKVTNSEPTNGEGKKGGDAGKTKTNQGSGNTSQGGVANSEPTNGEGKKGADAGKTKATPLRDWIKSCFSSGVVGDDKGIGKLLKLDLECYPFPEPPTWLEPKNMPNLEKLYIRGGNLKKLSKDGKDTWSAEILRLKYMNDFRMNWREILDYFPRLRYLERVRCPKVTFCPCDGNGVWFGPGKPEQETASSNE